MNAARKHSTQCQFREAFAHAPQTAGHESKTSRVFHQFTMFTIAALIALMPLTGRTGELQLADAPLFLKTAVQPNIFFMLDDSGSMNEEILFNAGASGGGIDFIDLTPPSGSTALDLEKRRRLCVGFNVLAYDPDVRYIPWQGKDVLGNVYGDADTMEAGGFNEIRRNPYCPNGEITGDCDGSSTLGQSGISDLDDPNVIAYFLWTDADGDGAFDDGECSALDINNGVKFVDLLTHDPDGDSQPGTPNVPGAEQQRNFANWFSYYRKREYVVKRAVSELIHDSRARMGLSSIHNNKSVGTPIQDMDDITLPVNPTAQANKSALLNSLSKGRSTGGTPLRLGLKHAGQYYEGVSASTTWQTALFGGSPNHDISETVSALSPILNDANGGNCQQNFTILMSDGFWNGTSPTLPGSGNADDDGASPDATGDTVFDGGPYADAHANTLADVAMYYYERDLRADLTNEVPVISSVDNNTGQHMGTYTVAFGLQGTLDPFDTKTPGDPSDTDPNNAAFNWPAPLPDDPTTLDDMWHAAYNGRGLYLNAAKPGEVSSTLQSAIASISGKTGTAASVAATSGVLTANSRVYQAQFTSGDWSGDLRSVQIDLAGSQLGAEDWRAGEILKTLDPDVDREIITYNVDTDAGVAFVYSQLGASQKTALDTNPATGSPDGLGPERVSFLRGDHSDEVASGGIFRDRANGYVLGDIVNSAPVFVGAPPFLYPDDLEDPTALTKRYSDFRAAQNNRTPVVYVGANDGLFHGFNATNGAADSGKEILAYVPARIYSRLNELTDPGYTHRNYVDASPSYGDAFFGGDWRSIIVGALGGGGQGVFALDVTDPSTFDEINASAIALWEFTDADDPDLGYTYGPAVIVKTRAGGKWAAVFGNGYNNTEADGSASTTGNAVLYVLFIEQGIDGTWTPSSDFIKIDTGKGTATSVDGTSPNGLATPAVVDADGDFVADFVFAGDLQGNMWKFDIRDSNPTNWDLANGSVPLFTATDASSQPQPITVQPEVLNHPTGQGGFMVYFGTGKYIENGDNLVSGAQTNTFYGVWDQLGSDTTVPMATVPKAKLQTQTLSTDSAGGQTVRVFSSSNPITAWGTGAGEHMGWRVDLPAPAEKNVTNPMAIGERMLFTTLIPLESPCAFGGTGFLMELNIVNGGPLAAPVFDIDGDGEFDTNDLSDGGFVVVGINPDVGLLPQPAVLAGGGGGSAGGGGGGGGDCFYLKVEAGTKDPETGATIKNKCPEGGIARRRSWRQLR